MSTQNYEWEQNFSTSIISISFEIPKFKTPKDLFVIAEPKRIVAGYYGLPANICGTLCKEIDESLTKKGIQNGRIVVKLTPLLKSAWPRLCLKADFDAIYIKKVKVHTPWAPKNDKELKLKVGDVVGVTIMYDKKRYRGELFNTGAKRIEGDFPVSVVRELSEQEKSDLMIVSKNGWLTVNGKKSFVVLHTGQLYEYSKEPKRDQTIKQLALAKAQHKINELCTVSLEKNKQLKLTLSDGAVLLIESEKELIGDWLYTLERTIDHAKTVAEDASDARASHRVKTLRRASQGPNQAAALAAAALIAVEDEEESDSLPEVDVDLDFSDLAVGGGGGTGVVVTSTPPPAGLKSALKQPTPQPSPVVHTPVAPSTPSDEGLDPTLAALYAVAPSFREFVTPDIYITSADQTQLARLALALAKETDTLPKDQPSVPANIPPIAVSSLPSNAAASSGTGTPRSRQVVMEDLRALKASLDAGDVDQETYDVARQMLLDELTQTGITQLAAQYTTPPPTVPTPPPEPHDDHVDAPLPPTSPEPMQQQRPTRPDIIKSPRPPIAATLYAPAVPDTLTRQDSVVSNTAPDWENMDAEDIFNAMLSSSARTKVSQKEKTSANSTLSQNNINDYDMDPTIAEIENAIRIAGEDWDVDDDAGDEMDYLEDIIDAQPLSDDDDDDFDDNNNFAAPLNNSTLTRGDEEDVMAAAFAEGEIDYDDQFDDNADDDDEDSLPEVSLDDATGLAQLLVSPRANNSPPLDTADSPAPAAPRPARVQPSTMDLWEQEEAERLAALEDASPEAKLKAAEQRILTLQKEQSKIIEKRQTLKLSRPTSAGSSAPAMTLPSRTHLPSRDDTQCELLREKYERRGGSGPIRARFMAQLETVIINRGLLTELVLTACNIDETALLCLAQAFDDFRAENSKAQYQVDFGLKVLKMGHNPVSREAGEKLRMIVNACPQLQILHINSLNLKPNDFEALTRDEMLSKLPLEEIDVSGNSLKGGGLRALVRGLATSTTLQTFICQHCSLDAKLGERIGPLFRTASLRHLDIGYNKLGDGGVRKIMNLAAQQRKLTYFDCSATGIKSSTASVLARWLNHNTQLKVLKCAWNNLGPAGLLFGKAVAKHNSLQELDVSRTNLGKTIEFMIRGAGACISMKRVHLSQNTIDIKAQRHLVRMINDGACQLTHLYVRDCHLSSKCTGGLFLTLKRPEIKLVYLDIAVNKIDKEPLAKHIGQCLSEANTIETLHLAATGLNMKTLSHILDGVAQCPSMHTLHLDGHPRAKRWLKPLSRVVDGGKCQLKELTLRNCNVTEDDAIEFLEHLKHINNTIELTTLRLEHNKPLNSHASKERVMQVLKDLRAAQPSCPLKITWRAKPENTGPFKK